MHLGLGFSCFTVFCVGSTISSLGIRVPSVPAEARDIAAKEDGGAKARPSRLTGWPAIAAVAVLAAAFVALLAWGVALPLMELRLDMALLYERRPMLKAFEGFINELHLPELMHEEVSGWSCLRALWTEVLRGEVNSGLALVMFGGFMILMPFLDMLVLLLAACFMHGPSPNSRGSRAALATSRVLRKLSMLDVAIMGVVVIVLSMQGMKRNGVILSMREGIPVLAGAKVCHFLASSIVERVRDSSDKLNDVATEGSSSEVSTEVGTEQSETSLEEP